MPLRDRVILITGASRGIGAACAVACARAGAKVAIAGKTVEPNPKLPGTLGEVAARVCEVGGEVEPLQVDVRDEVQVERMVERTVERFGRLDALVNNAGAIFLGPVADWSTKRYDLVMGINVRAAFVASHAALPHLRKEGGHVLMMSPPVRPKVAAGKAPYVISKLGMTLLAEAIDAEEPRVRAHALWPVTAIRTAATVNFGLGSEADWRTPEIVADAAVHLLTRDPLRGSFRAWLDEEVLREHGVTDFSKYRCDPSREPQPYAIRMFDPDWRPD